MTDSPVTYEAADGVAWITLNRPAVLNALNTELAATLADHADTAARDEAVGVVVVRGAGRAFCSGMDRTALARGDIGEAFYRHWIRALNGLEDMPKIVLGVLHGYSIGGGLQLALACDLRVGSERARDHRALRVDVGLLGRQPPAPNQVRDEGMVVGQLLEAPAAQAVGARVPHVADGEAGVAYERGGDGRPHPRDLRVVRRALVDAPVRFLDDGHEPLLGIEVVRVVELTKRGGGQARRDLAGLRAAHAVRDGEERRLDDV